MKIFDALKSDYFTLFVKREGKVVLGKNYSNLWLLTTVLTITFLAIAFSNASLQYLSYKMDDPFINWVDIKNEYGEGDFTNLQYALDTDENKEKYHYYSYQSDYYFAYWFFGRTEDNTQYLRCRFFQDIKSSLVAAILNNDNVVKDWCIKDLSLVDNNSIGVIITEEAMKKLGFDKAPTYINLARYADEMAAEYGFEIFSDSFAKVPLPVLAVVKRLPGNVDLIASSYLYEQDSNDMTNPFNLGANEEYARSLYYFVPENIEIEELATAIQTAGAEVANVELKVDEYGFYKPEIVPFKAGKFIGIECYDDMDYGAWVAINNHLIGEFGDKGLYRVFDYNFSYYTLSQKAFISVNFRDLDKIREFEQFVRDTFKVKIEMAQINAKENFNAVSTMGNILSWVIIAFAIVCIILFIVNLLQSYFQKVKRNLGTFKAFGISNRDLISVYVLILVVIILAAIVMSVSITWLIQGVMHTCGILKDGVFDYLLLWSAKTVCSIIVVILASTFTVYAVMHNLLKATPGDLIYDRQ